MVHKLFTEGQSRSVDQPNKEGETPLNIAAGKGYADIVRVLLREGKARSVDTPDSLGWTPLCLAAFAGHLEVMRCLLREGKAKSDKPNAAGETPLLCAAKQGNA